MYNLFVSADCDDWKGNFFEIDSERCIRVNEYTSKELTEQFGNLDNIAIDALMLFPCIFAYETFCKQSPKFGRITRIAKRQKQLRVQYEILSSAPVLTHQDLEDLRFELDLGSLELNRTHWAVKDVNLTQELGLKGINLLWKETVARKSVDITSHYFHVGLSFPGEARHLVKPIANQLTLDLGPHSCFYDDNYTAQLARPSLDVLLQDIYRNRSKLVVVFLSGDYQRKEWCGVEFRAIKEVLMQREHARIMFVRMDDGDVQGVFKTDGYIDGRKYSVIEIVEFIKERVELLG